MISQDSSIGAFSSTVCGLFASGERGVPVAPGVKLTVEIEFHDLLRALGVSGAGHTWLDRIMRVAQESTDGCASEVSRTVGELVAARSKELPARRPVEERRLSMVDQMKSAVPNMPARDVAGYLTRTVPTIEGGIRCNELSELLEAASERHRGDVVVRLAPYVRRPFSEGCFNRLSELVSSRHVSQALEALQTASPKI